jgi:hypothetical protein
LSGLDVLQFRFPQVYENFEKDAFVNSIKEGTKTLKEIFYEEVSKLVDNLDFEDNANKLCFPYKKRGPFFIATTGTDVGGTAVPLEYFIKDLLIEIQSYLLANPGMGLATISDIEIKKKFMDAGQKKNYKGLRFLIKGYNIGNVSLRRNYTIMWSYLNDKNPEDVFYGMDQQEINTLPCTLGLDPNTFSLDYICFGHKLQSNIVTPTAMDAGMFPYWRPGGKTKPLDSCTTYLGKTEVVHTPNVLSNLVDQIEIITKISS